MVDFILTKTRILAGVYEGVLETTSETAILPELEGVFLEKPVGELTVEQDPSLAQTWHVKFHMPANVLTDGIQTFLIIDKATSETLDSFTIVTGEPLKDDLQAEIDLLRAELDMLKKAFRRHCVETS